MLDVVRDKLMSIFYGYSEEAFCSVDYKCESEYVLLDILIINNRILSIIKCDNNYYLCYNFQERQVITNNNEIAFIKELLISCLGNEVNLNNIESVLNSDLTIYEYLDLYSDYYRVGQINKKKYEPKLVMLEDITDYVPKKDAYLTDFVGLYTIIRNY